MYNFLIELGYGQDLYMNSEDEDEIRAKTEFEKESILAERHEKRRLLLE